MHLIDDQKAIDRPIHRGHREIHRHEAGRLARAGPHADLRDPRATGRRRHQIHRRLGLRRRAHRDRHRQRPTRDPALHRELNDIPMMIVQHHESEYFTRRCIDTFRPALPGGGEPRQDHGRGDPPLHFRPSRTGSNTSKPSTTTSLSAPAYCTGTGSRYWSGIGGALTMNRDDKPIVYGAPYSVYVRAARLALEEKGVDYELVPVDIFAPDGPPPEYRARAPVLARYPRSSMPGSGFTKPARSPAMSMRCLPAHRFSPMILGSCAHEPGDQRARQLCLSNAGVGHLRRTRRETGERRGNRRGQGGGRAGQRRRSAWPRCRS